MDNIRAAFLELANEVKKILKQRIDLYGINPKTGTNTLKGSELEKSINVTTLDNGIALQIYDYWEYVSLGWRRTHRFPNTMSQFVENINSWIVRKGIRLGNLTQSQMVYLIIKNIMEKGLRERPFMVWNEEGDLTKMLPELEGYIDKWFDDLFNKIIENLNKYFN